MLVEQYFHLTNHNFTNTRKKIIPILEIYIDKHYILNSKPQMLLITNENTQKPWHFDLQ